MSSPENPKANGRLKMIYALAIVEIGIYEDSLAILMDNFVMPDIKEGEFSISHIWLEIHRKKLVAEYGISEITGEEIYKKICCYISRISECINFFKALKKAD